VALVVNQDTKEVIFEKNPNVSLPIASITKLMTAMVVLDAKLPLDEILVINAEDVQSYKHSRIALGSAFSREDFLRLALMSSENRAAYTLGRNYPGGMNAFVAAMNRKAKELGMANSKYADPTGLMSENVASAEDLTRMLSAAYQYKLIRGKLPPTYDLFAPLPSKTHYLISFLSFHKDILNIRGTSGNHANLRPIDNHPLRVKFMAGEIDEEEFINTLEKDDFEYYKHMSYWYVYLMVFNTATILFDNLYAYRVAKVKIKKKKTEDFMFDIYFQLQKTLEYANNVITYNDNAFGVDERFKKFKRCPY
jgi:hypothetical protein